MSPWIKLYYIGPITAVKSVIVRARSDDSSYQPTGLTVGLQSGTVVKRPTRSASTVDKVYTFTF